MAKRKVRRVTPEERIAARRLIAKSVHTNTDTQRKAVYKWQEDCLGFGNQCDWTLLECERFISYVWHSYCGTRATPPKISAGHGSTTAWAKGRWEICLPVWARNRNVILHELAHALLDAFRGRNVVGHGPRFVRMEIELLVAFGVHGRDRLIKTAREQGIKVARRESVPRRRSCETTLAECKTKHYHSMGEDLDDWMKKGTPRIVHVKGKTYRVHR